MSPSMLKGSVSEVIKNHAKWIVSGGRDGARANLAGIDLTGIDLHGVDLSAPVLRGAVLRSAGLSGAVLATADLSLVNGRQATCRAPTFGGRAWTGQSSPAS
jgi:uncharacterized protein YjbI with pentapeptide repeats